MYFVAPIRPAAASFIKPLASSIYLFTNEKQFYVIMSGFRQCIPGYIVANLCRYPIRRRVAFASALESSVDINFLQQVQIQQCKSVAVTSICIINNNNIQFPFYISNASYHNQLPKTAD